MYESYFGLSDKPFKLSPDPKFFFESPHHGKAISYLRYGLELGEGFIVVTGPIGTGKTTIARNLLSTLNESIVAAQIATTRLTPDELISLVAAEFGLTTEGLGKADILKRLQGFLLGLNRQGRRALLIIDEAQNLPAETIEELRMLSNFQVDDRPLIQSFLLGQEELKPIIELPEMEQFRQRIIASCHLKPLNKEQTKNYILHRLNQVGWDNKPEIEPKIFKTVANYTGGVPRKINIFMDRLFLFAFMEHVDVIKLHHVEDVIEEMGGELSGGFGRGVTSSKITKKAEGNVELLSEEIFDADKIHQTLKDVNSILDGVVNRKTLTIKYLDRLIREKRKTLSDPDENETDISDDNTGDTSEENRLIQKNWMQQLIKAQETEI